MRVAIRGITLFSLTNNGAGAAKARSSFEANARDMQDVIRELASGGLPAGDASAVDAIRVDLEEWIGNFPEFADLCASGRVAEANELTLRKTTPIMDAIQKRAAELGHANRERRDAATAAFNSSVSNSGPL